MNYACKTWVSPLVIQLCPHPQFDHLTAPLRHLLILTPGNDGYIFATEQKSIKIKTEKKLPSKWLPGRKHLILAETGFESVLVPPAQFHFGPFHPYKYGALIASIPSCLRVHVPHKLEPRDRPIGATKSRALANRSNQNGGHAQTKRVSCIFQR